MNKELKTLNNFVILEWVDPEETRKSGVVVNMTKSNVPVVSKIVAMNIKNEQELEVGDELLFYRHAAEDIEIDGVKRLIISEKAMIGVYK